MVLRWRGRFGGRSSGRHGAGDDARATTATRGKVVVVVSEGLVGGDSRECVCVGVREWVRAPSAGSQAADVDEDGRLRR